MAYAKIDLFDALGRLRAPDDPAFAEPLKHYFPTRCGSSRRMATHRLRREIIATVLADDLVNLGGPTFVAMLKENTGMPAAARSAYAVTRGAFQLRDIWGRIEALDTKVPAALQTEMLIETTKLAESGTSWFLRNGEHPLDIAANLAAYGPGIKALLAGKNIVCAPMTGRRSTPGPRPLPPRVLRPICRNWWRRCAISHPASTWCAVVYESTVYPGVTEEICGPLSNAFRPAVRHGFLPRLLARSASIPATASTRSTGS